MEAGKEDRRARPGKSEQKRAAQGSATGVMIPSTATATTIVTDNGHVLTVSDYITRFDEATKRRLDNMNQKLMRLEMQMEVLEAEMSRANESSKWG